MAWRGAIGPGLAPVLLGLAACAPAPVRIPVAEAERVCMVQALDARSPRTQVGLGVGSGGYRGGFVSVDLSSDQILGRDPSQVFDRCVLNRSGQMPTRPLYQQPGWGVH
ncbi:hypothetical protein BDE18_1939 [Paracoccus pantotrophus]|uniref:Lipoprotein n=1 Tax=Paracoccus pantotrophus TaxID=82367 RepID=A0AAE6NY33_PARPN|nr:hypothetical protein [Paracoccus pantotrophus]QFG36978.1 hypothetical protein ESD82_12360 [Paracoccus pantotrophus]RKS52609.1 hypothetical protein BDE18_1939 [Paracoccus pantotrophus]